MVVSMVPAQPRDQVKCLIRGGDRIVRSTQREVNLADPQISDCQVGQHGRIVGTLRGRVLIEPQGPF